MLHSLATSAIFLMAVTTIDLIRHGEPVGGRKYRGQTDDPLSEKGFRQMWESVGDYSEWDQIITSPLSRCAAFAEALRSRLGLPLKIDHRLMEVGFGAWEGKTPQQLKEEDPRILSDFKRDPVGRRPAGAEPLDEFYRRVVAAWDDLVEEFHGHRVLVVCHAGVIRMSLAHVLEMPLASAYRVQVASAAVTRIAVEGRGRQAVPTLLFHDGNLAAGRRLSE